MKHRLLKCIMVFLGLTAAACCVSIWISYNLLTVTRYRIESGKVNTPFRVVLLADLHDHQFGKDNKALLEQVSRQQPDLIILDGDMVNRDSADANTCLQVIRGLRKELPKVPLIFAMGNHELDYIRAGHPDFQEELIKAGAAIADRNVSRMKIGNNNILVGGLYQYGFETGMQQEEDNASMQAYREVWNSSAGQKDFCIMCAHRPESFYCWYTADLWNVDLIVSGHDHGGQVILPFAGGLYTSLEGFLPQFDFGLFYLGAEHDVPLIITRGLSSNIKKLPRFNNPPEITVIDIEPAS